MKRGNLAWLEIRRNHLDPRPLSDVSPRLSSFVACPRTIQQRQFNASVVFFSVLRAPEPIAAFALTVQVQ